MNEIRTALDNDAVKEARNHFWGIVENYTSDADEVERFGRILANAIGEALALLPQDAVEPAPSSEKALRAIENELRLEVARAKLKEAFDWANGRWSEWGERAEHVLVFLEELDALLASSPAPSAETPEAPKFNPSCGNCIKDGQDGKEGCEDYYCCLYGGASSFWQPKERSATT